MAGWPGGTWVFSPPDLILPNRQANQAGFYGAGDIWSVGGINGATFQFLAEVQRRNNGGGCPSPTPTPTVTPTPTATPVARRSWSTEASPAGDPTHDRSNFPRRYSETCAAPKVCPGPFDPTPHHYDSYTFSNTTGATQCVTVTTDAMTCVGNNFTFVAAYLGSFDPNNLCTNYIADSGAVPIRWNPGDLPVRRSYGQSFVVVVNEVNPGAGCPGYTVTVDGTYAVEEHRRQRRQPRQRQHRQLHRPQLHPTPTPTSYTPPPTPTPTATPPPTPTPTPAPTPTPFPRPTPGPSATPHGTPPRP